MLAKSSAHEKNDRRAANKIHKAKGSARGKTTKTKDDEPRLVKASRWVSNSAQSARVFAESTLARIRKRWAAKGEAVDPILERRETWALRLAKLRLHATLASYCDITCTLLNLALVYVCWSSLWKVPLFFSASVLNVACSTLMQLRNFSLDIASAGVVASSITTTFYWILAILAVGFNFYYCGGSIFSLDALQNGSPAPEQGAQVFSCPPNGTWIPGWSLADTIYQISFTAIVVSCICSSITLYNFLAITDTLRYMVLDGVPGAKSKIHWRVPR